MALKKSELYSSLWSSCDELRGGMDASQYKDYVLVMLFVKYVSDKYAGVPYAPITIPPGASFKDMVALKGKASIGDDINKRILEPLAKANRLSDMPDFNDATKLGSGREMVDRLTNLVAIFEDKRLDFSKNRADGDDILGDAYEYLMRHFATESGKSKGQFYTPAEVSRVMAQIIGIREAKTTNDTTVYDPTCGSGSLLLKVGDEASAKVTLYGQEKDSATAGLARMNMILHDNPNALVEQANTELEKVNKPSVRARLREIEDDAESDEEAKVLREWVTLSEKETALKRQVTDAAERLDELAFKRYPTLTEGEVKVIVVEDKWITAVSAAVHDDVNRVIQALSSRLRDLAHRYGTPMSLSAQRVADNEKAVNCQLKRMGFEWD